LQILHGVKVAGQIKLLIDQIVSERSKGSVIIANTTKTKLILKGIDPDKYSLHSEDDPVVIRKLIEFKHAKN
jgi:hypothetical protein